MRVKPFAKNFYSTSRLWKKGYEQTFASVKRVFVFSVHVFALFFYCAVGSEAAGRWIGAEAPRSAGTGDRLAVRLAIRNDTGRVLEPEGPGRVWLSAMVVDSNGSPCPMEPAAASLGYPVPLNAVATSLSLGITAPDLPGSYVILVGLVSTRDGKVVALDRDILRLPLVVTAKRGPSPAREEGPVMGMGAVQADRSSTEPDRRS
jgi:hypothetical protein